MSRGRAASRSPPGHRRLSEQDLERLELKTVSNASKRCLFPKPTARKPVANDLLCDAAKTLAVARIDAGLRRSRRGCFVDWLGGGVAPEADQPNREKRLLCERPVCDDRREEDEHATRPLTAG